MKMTEVLSSEVSKSVSKGGFIPVPGAPSSPQRVRASSLEDILPHDPKYSACACTERVPHSAYCKQNLAYLHGVHLALSRRRDS